MRSLAAPGANRPPATRERRRSFRAAVITSLLAVAGPALPARAAGFDFESALEAIRAAALSRRPHFQAAARRIEPAPASAGVDRRIADPADFARLVARARREPTSIQEVAALGATYRVYVVRTSVAFPNQACEGGAAPVNTMYVAVPENGTGGSVYPFRLSTMCEGDQTYEAFMADADSSGVVQDWAIYVPAAGRVLHADKDSMTPVQRAAAEAYLASLVRLFLSVP